MISTTEIHEEGEIRTIFGSGANKAAQGKTLSLFPWPTANENLKWDCEGTLDEKYMPTGCGQQAEPEVTTTSRTVDCGPTKMGSITQEQTVTTPTRGSPSYGEWADISNTCYTPTPTVTTETETKTCTAHYNNSNQYNGNAIRTRTKTVIEGISEPTYSNWTSWNTSNCQELITKVKWTISSPPECYNRSTATGWFPEGVTPNSGSFKPFVYGCTDYSLSPSVTYHVIITNTGVKQDFPL